MSLDAIVSPYLTRPQLLGWYNISNPTLKKWLRTGRFPKPVKIGEGEGDLNNLRARWLRTDIEAYDAKCRTRTFEKRKPRKKVRS